jgi:hypothetical protein
MENMTNRGETGLDLIVENTDVHVKEDESGLIKKSIN